MSLLLFLKGLLGFNNTLCELFKPLLAELSALFKRSLVWATPTFAL